MRISKKIGLSFFITFLLVILLGALSIYSLRNIYKGLEQIFSKDLPASRVSYELAISMEEVFSELNNFLITMNENFKPSYEKAYKGMQDDLAILKKFISKDEEGTYFENVANLSKDLNKIANSLFKNSMEIKKLFKDIKNIEAKYNGMLNELFDFEENKMLNEKDLLLIQAQYIPASTLIIQAKLKLSDLLDNLTDFAMKNQGDKALFQAGDIALLEGYIKDYKNFYGYSLSDKERATAKELITLSQEIDSIVNSIIKIKKDILGEINELFIKEKDILESLDKIIAFKKSGISSRLGIGATLTEDIPAIHNISKIERDMIESWRVSGRYVLTNNEDYRLLYYQLRQVIDKALKDYEVHARLRGREKFLEDIKGIDKDILENINSNIAVFDRKEKNYAELLSVKAFLEKRFDELLLANDSLIKEAKDSQSIFNNIVPSRWALVRLGSELSDALRLIMSYLNDEEPKYKNIYSETYFNMKKYVNESRNFAATDKDIRLITEIDRNIDKFNTLALNVISDHDNIIKESGWTLVKLEEDLKESLGKAVQNEITQVEKNKRDIKNKIATINTLIFLIIGAIAIIAVFIIFYTTSSITNPIRELYKGAEVIGHGNLDHRLNIKTGDEIEELADGFNRMAGELKELYTNLENKVKERTIQLAEANEALARTNKELDDFTYIVSHDLKEPLRGVKAFTKLLLEDYSLKLDNEGKEYLKTISDSSTRMTRLIEDLLNLSRIGRIKNIEEGVELDEVLLDVKKNLAYSLEERNVDLKIKAGFPKVTCDRIRISEVFLNLISNAIKYTKKDIQPIIEVGYVDKGIGYEFYVKDNGIGIEKQYYNKVFQIFQRLHAKGEYEGTGAGLTIVKKIIENHSGKIWLKSEVGTGTTFYFTLPK